MAVFGCQLIDMPHPGKMLFGLASLRVADMKTA